MNRRALILAAPILLTGCGTVLDREKYQPRTDWPLDPAPPSISAATPGSKVVLVRSVIAGPGLAERGLLTLLPNGSLHRGYYNRWAVPPADAITASLITWLQATNGFGAVIGDGSALTPNLIIDATLESLLADPSTHQARARLSLVIATPRGFGESPVLQRQLRAQAPLAGSTAADLVTAQRHVVASLLSQAVALITNAARGTV